MKHLGSLRGNGDIRVGDNVVANADYQIEVWAEDSGLKSARGFLNGNFFELHKAFEAQGADLELETGGTARIIITRLSTDSGCEIVVSGPVPGF